MIWNAVTAAVVKRMGGFGELCRADDVEWRRKSFMSIFKETLDKQKEIASFNKSQLTDAEKKRNECACRGKAKRVGKLQENRLVLDCFQRLRGSRDERKADGGECQDQEKENSGQRICTDERVVSLHNPIVTQTGPLYKPNIAHSPL